MFGLDLFTSLYVVAALQFHIVLLIHFSLRRWRFDVALRYGWIVYALSIPSAALSMFLLVEGAPWWMWTGGFLYLVWAVFGFIVEYVRQIEWRGPVVWNRYWFRTCCRAWRLARPRTATIITRRRSG